MFYTFCDDPTNKKAYLTHFLSFIHLLGGLNREVGDADVVRAALLLDGDGVGCHRLKLPEHGHQLPPQSAR